MILFATNTTEALQEQEKGKTIHETNLRAKLEEYHKDCYGWALYCCNFRSEEAEDVLQSVYLKILEGKARYEGRSTFKTWLFAIIRNTAANERRRRLLQILGLGRIKKEHASETYRYEPIKALDRLIVQKLFLDALKKLPNRQREVLHLVFYQDMTLQEASEVMQISIGSVRQHYERGKQKMRDLLENSEAFNECR